MNVLRCFVGLTCWTAIAPLALAHPGHGTDDSGAVGHYLLEPAHALPVLAVGAGLIAAVVLWRKLRRRRSVADSR